MLTLTLHSNFNLYKKTKTWKVSMYYCTTIFVDHSTGNPSLTLDNKLSEYLVLYCPIIQNCLIKNLNVLNQDNFTAFLLALRSRSHVSETIGDTKWSMQDTKEETIYNIVHTLKTGVPYVPWNKPHQPRAYHQTIPKVSWRNGRYEEPRECRSVLP